MSRNLDSTLSAHLGDGFIQPAIFASFTFNTGVVNAWSGVGPFTWNDMTFSGVGNFGRISAITESTGVQADGITVQLLGVPLPTQTGTPPYIVQQRGEDNGTWLSDQTLAFANALAGSNSLLAFLTFRNPCDTIVLTFSDTQTNGWVVPAYSDNYGLAYTLSSSTGNDSVSVHGEDFCGFTYDTGLLIAEVGGAVGDPAITTFTGSSSKPNGSVNVNGNEYDFAVATAYDNWVLKFAVYSGAGTAALIVAILDIYAVGYLDDVVEGWTLGATNTHSGLYTQVTQDRTSSGIDASTVLSDVLLGAPATVWFGLMSDGQLIGTPYQIFKGMVDQPTVDVDTQTITVSLDLENPLTNLQRGNGRRYTAADQRLNYPDDTGFNWVEMLSDIALRWGQ